MVKPQTPQMTKPKVLQLNVQTAPVPGIVDPTRHQMGLAGVTAFLEGELQAHIQRAPVPRQPALMVPKPPVAQPQEITLFDWQVNWANRAYDIVLRNHGYIDTSRMRAGKTVVLMWLAKRFGFRLIVIGPVSVETVWRREAAKYGVEIITFISYPSLRSKRGFQPKHGLLDRFDNVTEGGVKQVSFAPTRTYTDFIEQGVMVVCDEIQNIKNNSSQYKACSALLRPIIAGGRSRFALLSGTPFDKEEHAVNLLRLIGYIRAYRLYSVHPSTREVTLEGMQELIDACRFINAAETDRVVAEVPLVGKQMNHLAYLLYIRVVKTGISGAMAAPVLTEGQYDVKNGLYAMTALRGQQLNNAVTDLARVIQFNPDTGAVTLTQQNLGDRTSALVRIENAKVDDFARVATSILTADPRNKVIISLNYTTTIDELRPLLIMYNPLTYNGQVTNKKKRAEIVRAFVEDANRRVLIMNTALGVGISLYSTLPDHPVYMLMSPTYKLLDAAQTAARVYGPGMVSKATVRMFYGQGAGELEMRILSALARKTQVLKGTLEEVVTRDLVLPGDYETETCGI
jgi:hypothetical protein